ncbi:outer membrane protein [Chelativorans sp. Marseille-P2723]|uniref:outer membrane protein n=1 Tax=Chelativorans sp. Marseille-P2723 TaxID=2709133 RepID=UPI00156E394F|nr:outer membrane protein [Chelativorans sp. Marseille-P2723]
MRILHAGVASFTLCFLAGELFAADALYLDEKTPEAHAFDWSGPYFGLAGGFAWSKAEVDGGAIVAAVLPDKKRLYADGMFGGVYAGYNRAFGPWIFGIEGDAQLSDIALEYRKGAFSASYDTDWFATARLRAGYSIGRILPYVTAGVALAHGTLKTEHETTHHLTFDQKDTFAGYALGAGMDMAFSERLIGRLEYLYLDLPDTLHKRVGDLDIEPVGHTLRFGMAYKF